MKQDSLGDNQKCLKGTFDKSLMKPVPSNTLFGKILARRKFGAIGAKWQKSPNLIIFSLRQIESTAKKLLF